MIIGIDFGKKKIGLAFSEGITASSLGTITNAPSRLIQISDLLNTIVPKPYPIEKFVLGLPNSPLDTEIKFFGEQLKTEFNCDVVYEDEFNSTQEAFQAMLDSGISRKKRRNDDSNAAINILQRYLDKNPS
jgi:putative transcription antitermination factor YqgF